MKRYILLVLITIILPIKVSADCTNEEIVRLQKLANNITLNYYYDEEKAELELNFTNMDSRLYIKNIDTNKEYSANGEMSINNIIPGIYTYHVFSKDANCYDGQLSIKNIKVPYFNKYYLYEECKGIENYRYCSKWLPNKITYSEWSKEIKKYKSKIEEKKQQEIEKNKKTFMDSIRELIVELYVTKYYIFLPMTIIALCAIIYLKNKSEQLI